MHFKKYVFLNMRAHFVMVHPLQLDEWKKEDIKDFLEWEKGVENIVELSTLSEIVEKFKNLEDKYSELVFRQEYLLNENQRLCNEGRKLENEKSYLFDRIDELENEKRMLKLELSKKNEKQKNGFSTFKNEECVICYQKPPNILFCSCGHICICDECETLASSSKCPVCREESINKRKI